MLGDMNSNSVFVVVTPEGKAWRLQSFPTMTDACTAVVNAEGVYWSQLLERGYRIAGAVLKWWENE